MRIDIMTLFPETVGDMMNESILGRAQERGFIRIEAHQIRAADGHVLPLEGKGRVHVVHPLQLHQQAPLVLPAGRRGEGAAVHVEGIALGQQVRFHPLGQHLDLSPDAVGVDDPSGGNKFQFHGLLSFIIDHPMGLFYYISRKSARAGNPRPSQKAGRPIPSNSSRARFTSSPPA